MDALSSLLAELMKLDSHWTARLRSDSFDDDRRRNQAVGRVKMIDEIKALVAELRKKQSAEDVYEEETEK